MNEKACCQTLQERIWELEADLRQRCEELRAARDRHRVLIETMPHAVQELALDGTIQFANPAHHRMYGYADGELIGRSVFEMVPTSHERERVEAYLRHICADQPSPTPWLGRGRAKDGRIFDIQVDWSYVRGPEGELRGLVAVGTDITERRSSELKLRRAHLELESRVQDRTAELEEAKRALERDIEARRRAERERDHLESKLRRAQTLEAVGRLAGGVAHDFNNILGSLLGCLYAVVQELPDRPDLVTELHQAQQLCKRGGDLTRQLLTVARRRPGLWEITTLECLFREIHPLLERALPKDIQVSVDLERGLPSIRVDRSRFTSALLGLAWNAGEAMPDGGTLTFRATPVPGGGGPREAVVVEVQDSGTGIVPEHRERIFEPFFTTKEPGKGHGLGLSTVYATIQECGGEIGLDATGPTGTTFRIVLPAAEHPLATTTTSDPATRFSPHPLTRQHVLVVEDEPPLARLMVNCLSRIGYRTLFAGDGLEALETLRTREGEVGLVLLDLALPGVRGEKVYEILQMVAPQLPVLIVTGRTQQALALAPGRPCLAKPFTEQELSDAVARVLDVL